MPGVSSLTRRWGQRRFNGKHLSARNKILRLETASHRGFLLVSLQKNAGLHSSSICFTDPTLIGAPGSYFSSPGTAKTTETVTTIISSLPLQEMLGLSQNQMKAGVSLCPYLSRPFHGIMQFLFGNPCYFPLLFVHSLWRLLFLSSSLSKGEPFSFVASGFHIRTASSISSSWCSGFPVNSSF